MLIKCQIKTQKFQENALLTKVSACHKHIEEFCISCVLLLVIVFWDDIKTFSFLFPTVGNTFVYYVFLSFAAFFPCYWWIYPISSYSISLLAVGECWIYLGIKFRPLTDIQHI